MEYQQYLLAASSALTTLILARFFFLTRYLFTKPSIVFLAFFNVFVQWPTFFYYKDIATTLSTTLLDTVGILTLFPLVLVPVTFSDPIPLNQRPFANSPLFT